MKQKKRQNALIVGAGLGLLIVLSQLFGGANTRGKVETTEVHAVLPEASMPEETMGSSSSPVEHSGFYQDVRRQLQTFIPEQSDAFVPAGEIRGSELGVQSEPESASRNPQWGMLPPMPVNGAYGLENSGLPIEKTETGNGQPKRRENGGDAGNDENSPKPADNPEPRVPRLRAFVLNTETGLAAALIEWNGTLLQISSEPGSEWQIISYDEENVVVKRGQEQWELKRDGNAPESALETPSQTLLVTARVWNPFP